MITGDGRCVIDVVHSSRGPARDAATSLMIKDAAARVVHFCVNGGQGTSRGGYVGHIGSSFRFWPPLGMPFGG